MHWDVIEGQESTSNGTLCFARITALLSYWDSIVQDMKLICQANSNQNVTCCRYAYDDHDLENGTGNINSRMQMVIDNTNDNVLVSK